MNIRENALRLAAMGLGGFLALYAASRGLDGALMAMGGLLIGYAIGKK